ncbi:MAG: hypothetical protein ACLTW9_29710 [Enterocloster sp.]
MEKLAYTREYDKESLPTYPYDLNAGGIREDSASWHTDCMRQADSGADQKPPVGYFPDSHK